jgi:cobalt-zinc-cadmium efflux system membrane fusion protein
MTDPDPVRSDPPAGGLPRRRQLEILGLAAVVGAILLFGAPAMTRLFAPKTGAAGPTAPTGSFVASNAQWSTLRFATVNTEPFPTQAETDGKIATDDDRTTQVFSPFSGRVTHVFAAAGEVVRAGQPLFAVDASEFAQGRADFATALAQFKLTEAAEARQRELVKANGAAVKDWQQSQVDLATAKANLEAVRNRLKILGETDADIARLEQGKVAGAEAIVASPINGVVTQRSVGVGQNVGSVTNGGSSAAFVVSDLSTVWLVGQLRENDAPMARVGEAVQVRVNALPDRVLNARVDYVSPTVDPVTHRLLVRAAIANPGRLLKPEMFASFTLVQDGAPIEVGVPEEAVIYEGDTARVWVAGAGRTLQLRQIKTGRTVHGVVEVLSGLRPGERVVTSGSVFIDRAAQGD